MHVHFEKWKLEKGLHILFWYVIYFLVYMAITILFAEMLPLSRLVSLDFMELAKPGDFVMLILVLLISVVSSLLLYRYLNPKEEKQTAFDFWKGQLAMLMLSNALLLLINQISILQFQSFNYKNLQPIIRYITQNYIALYIVLSIVMAFMLIVNKKQEWFKKNNWYSFFTVAPYIIELSMVYRYQTRWLDFIHMRNFSYSKLYKLLVSYSHQGGSITYLLFDDISKPLGIIMFISTAIMIYIGGEYVVYKIQQRRKAKA